MCYKGAVGSESRQVASRWWKGRENWWKLHVAGKFGKESQGP